MPTAPTSTDPLLETQLFWTRYGRQVMIALAVVLAGLALFGAYRFYVIRRDAAAAQLLATAKSAPEYNKIIADYPQSGAAVSAALLMAAQQREKQQFAEANTTLQKFISAHPKHEMVSTAKMAMASNLESLGKKEEALEMYRRIGADYAKSFNAPLALLAQVPLLKEKGQIDEARRVCETILTQYRDNYTSMEASRYLKMLKPPAGAPAAQVAPAPIAAAVQNPAAGGTAAASPTPTLAPLPK